jgi:hypothetical protein
VEFSSRSPDTWLDFIGTRVESVTVDEPQWMCSTTVHVSH